MHKFLGNWRKNHIDGLFRSAILHFKVELYFIIFVTTLKILMSISTAYAQAEKTESENVILDKSNYELKTSMDKKITCLLNKSRNKECNLDFDPCVKFLYLYDYYNLYFGVGSVVSLVSGDTDAKRQQEIQKKAQELIRLAQSNGVKDINMIAYDALDNSAKDELGVYKAKQAAHVTFLYYLKSVAASWMDEKNGYQSHTCSIENSNEVLLRKTEAPDDVNHFGCFAHPNDYSGITQAGNGCIESKIEKLSERDFFGVAYAESVVECVLKDESIPPPVSCFNNAQNPKIDEQFYEKYKSLIKTKSLINSETNDPIPNDSCVNYQVTLKNIFGSDKLFKFASITDINRQRCNFSIVKTTAPEINYQHPPNAVPIVIKLGTYSVTMTVCKHLCDTDKNFFAYVAPNRDNKQYLYALIQKVTENLNLLNEKIKAMEAIRGKLATDKKEYEDSFRRQNNGGSTNNEPPSAQDCAKNPFLAGCVAYNNYPKNPNASGSRKSAVPTAKTPDAGPSFNNALPNSNKENEISPASATSGDSGGESGGRPGGSDLGGTSVAPGEEEKPESADSEKSSLDMQGVSDYGTKGKKGISTGGVGSSSTTFKKDKVQNPFEDLFGKKDGKSANGEEKKPRDIASSNEEEDNMNGFSNLFTRITKTYHKKFSEGSIGDKNNLRLK